MEACTETECAVRLLGLGNELLADDAFGILVAREVERRQALWGRQAQRAPRLPTGFRGRRPCFARVDRRKRLSHLAPTPRAEVVCSSASGFHLLDQILGASRLIVVDTLATPATRASVPGTIHVFRAGAQACGAGASACQPGSAAAPHFVGLFDVLAVAASLALPAPREVTVIGVEAADCVTVGGEMHPDVRAAVGKAAEIAEAMLAPPPFFGGDGKCPARFAETAP
jgi:hydrogenase maturation protease